MTTDTPVACTLSAADYTTRLARLAALADAALLSREPIDGGERLTFTDTPDVERDLLAAIAAEAACCAFLSMRLERSRAGIALDITGPAAARPIIAELFA